MAAERQPGGEGVNDMVVSGRNRPRAGIYLDGDIGGGVMGGKKRGDKGGGEEDIGRGGSNGDHTVTGELR